MYMAGVDVKWKDDASDQDMHQKSIVLHGRQLAVFGSSNWTASSSDTQREHNYFTQKPWFVEWFVDAVQSQVEQLTRIDGGAISPPMFLDFVPGLSRERRSTPLPPTARSARARRSRFAGKAASGRTSTTSTSAPPVTAAARRAGLRAGIGDSGRDRRTRSRTRSANLQPGVDLLLADPQQDDGEQGRQRHDLQLHDVGRQCDSAGADRAVGHRDRRDARRSGVDRRRRRGGLQGRAQALDELDVGADRHDVRRRHLLHGREQRTARPERPTTTACGRSRPPAIPATATSRRVTTPFPTISPGDVVLYASEASVRVGSWSPVSDATAAGGARLNNPNAGAARLDTAARHPGALLRDELHGASGRRLIDSGCAARPTTTPATTTRSTCSSTRA